VIDRMVSDARVLMSEGVGFAAICSNDAASYHYFGGFWRLIADTGFPNRVFNDSWVVGFWRAGHGEHYVEVGR
jgi:hypothetical protein